MSIVGASTVNSEVQQKVFFPNLDGFRFISFLLVFWFHVNKVTFINLQDHPVHSYLDRIFGNGELGVNFFFVLSGFLITYLLFQEKGATGKVNIANFYVRRVLRIWPLFYLSVFIGFVVFPIVKQMAGLVPVENANPAYYLFFLNNFDYISNWPQFPDALSLIVLWSVAVEEQFYLVWPVVIFFVRKKLYPLFFSAVIIGSLVFRFFHLSEDSHNVAVLYFHTFSVMGDLAIGALFAYYAFVEPRFVVWLKGLGRGSILFMYVLAVMLIMFKHEIFISPFLLLFERVIIAIVFGLLIMEQNYSRNSFFKLGNFKISSQLGKYTYGLYCYHFLVLSLTQSLFMKLGLDRGSLLVCVVISLSALLLTIITSHFSYLYFEGPFLKLKNRFSVVTSN